MDDRQQPVLTVATQRTRELRSAHVAFSVTAAFAPTGIGPIEGTGLVDFHQRRVRYDIDFSSMFAPPGSDTVVMGHAVLSGAMQFFTWPLFDHDQRLRGKWLREDVELPPRVGEIELLRRSSNALTILDLVTADVGTEESLGTTEIDGVVTQLVRVPFDAEAFIRRSSDSQESVDRLVASMGPPAGRIEACVDDRHRIRRLEARLLLGLGLTVQRFDYSRFDDRVTIEVPGPHEVVDVTEMT